MYLIVYLENSGHTAKTWWEKIHRKCAILSEQAVPLQRVSIPKL